MRPSMPACLAALAVAFALAACADEPSTPTASASGTPSTVPAPLITPHPLRPTGTAPPAPPPTFVPPTAEPTFATPDPSRTQRPAPTPRAPEPRAPTPERPSSPTHPPGTRTGLAEVDAVLEAFETRDLDAVMAVVELTEYRCSDPWSQWQSQCDGATPSAAFRGFWWSNFEGAYIDDPREPLARLLLNWLGVYAIARAPDPPPGVDPWPPRPDTWIIFVEESIPRSFEGGIALLRGGRLVGVGGWGEPSYYLEWYGAPLEVILPPPLRRGP